MSTIPARRLIPLDIIDEPRNPMRKSFDDQAFFELVDSLRAVGQLQPLIVFPIGERYEIAVGHRRFKAAKYLRWPTIDCSIVPPDPDTNEMRKAHENAFREAVEPEDEGTYYTHLATEKKLGVREIAKLVGRSPYYVESRLKCVLWPQDVKDALRNKMIGIGVAEAFADITDQEERARLMAYGIQAGINTRTAKAWAESWIATKSPIDAPAIAAATASIPTRYEEPMFPCFACERPTIISTLAIVRLCKECYADFTAAADSTDNRGHSQGDSGEREPPRAGQPETSGPPTADRAGPLNENPAPYPTRTIS